jgi:hypothetical protein
MCQLTLAASDIDAVVEAQAQNIDSVKAALIGVRPLYASEVLNQLEVISAQGPSAIMPALLHAFLTGLQVGQELPNAYYPGREFYVETGSDEFDENDLIGSSVEEYDEEEETELTFQSVRNS